MFQRKNASSLPTTSPLSLPTGDSGGAGVGLGAGGYSGSNMGYGMSNRGPDGSGKAIKMDAPVVKAWKKTSSWTKYSYIIMSICVTMMFIGYRYLRMGNASVWLTCHAEECTLEMTPPAGRTKTVIFPRTQLHSVQAIKTDVNGNFLSLDTSKYEPPARKKGKKSGKGSAHKGPDENGEYRSYQFKILPKAPSDGEKGAGEDADFSPVVQYFTKGTVDDGTDEVYILSMRTFGLTQSRIRVRSNVNKVESYIKRRREKLIIKESASLPAEGILFLVFGLFGALLTVLIGQFWDEPPKKQAGPGVRRTVPSARKASNPTFVVDTGRPSKYPPGYGYNKKY